jgi:tetratricopeptide (TPR) repeat protein
VDLGELALRRGSYAAAVGYLDEAAAIERREGRSWERLASMRVPLTAHAYALGRALAQSGRAEAARPWLERARRLSPGLPGLEAWLSRLEGGADAAPAPRERAIRLAQAGRFAEAESLFAGLARGREPDEYAWGALVRLQAQSGRVAAARATLDEGMRAGWRGTAAELHASLVLALEGRTAEARRRLGAIDPAAIRRDPALADLEGVVRRRLAGPGR